MMLFFVSRGHSTSLTPKGDEIKRAVKIVLLVKWLEFFLKFFGTKKLIKNYKKGWFWTVYFGLSGTVRVK